MLTHRALTGSLVILSILGTICSPALADVVYLKNGKVLEGNTEEKDGQVVVRMGGGSLTLNKEDVDRIEKKEFTPRQPTPAAPVQPTTPTTPAAPAPTTPPVQAGPATPPPPAQPAASGPKTVPDGTYNGTSRGYVDEVNVQVTVKDGKVTVVKITGHKENRALTSLTDVPPLIVQKQSTKVNSTTGATVTSLAVMRAAQAALDSSAPITLADVPDGRYTGESKGMMQAPNKRGLAVEVEVKDHKIVSVKVSNNYEQKTNVAAQKAITEIPALIVAKQSTTVDPVAGGEVTSRAIMRAAQAALDSAVPRVLSGK